MATALLERGEGTAADRGTVELITADTTKPMLMPRASISICRAAGQSDPASRIAWQVVLYDKDLSVNRNEACAFCHTPETGFTGPVSELNRTTAAYPASVRTRSSNRKPETQN
jgi:cytochrome c peroxidase